ncbi:MAG TPA: PLP-dependent aminotransferase family protein, partial [Mycobacteriales bacterium]|nr:PLP-dependent aminotransferase family protein [Mycobacteriales bacterium]
KLVYVVVNFSNPSGATLSAERRGRLVTLSERYGFVVVADDPYGALRFTGDDVPAMGGDVVHLGSWSKVLAPALRVGHVVAPEWLQRPLVLAKQAADLTSSVLAQRVVAHLVGDRAWLDAHVDGLREVYRSRCEALLGALDERFDIVAPGGGMFVWARLPVDAEPFAARCLEREVGVVPGNEFAVDGRGFEREVRLSFSQLDPDGLREAARRMGEAL